MFIKSPLLVVEEQAADFEVSRTQDPGEGRSKTLTIDEDIEKVRYMTLDYRRLTVYVISKNQYRETLCKECAAYVQCRSKTKEKTNSLAK